VDPAVDDDDELEEELEDEVDELDVSEELGEDVEEDESAVLVDASFEPVPSLLDEDDEDDEDDEVDEDESLARLSVR
jgi:hypothetical protein